MPPNEGTRWACGAMELESLASPPNPPVQGCAVNAILRIKSDDQIGGCVVVELPMLRQNQLAICSIPAAPGSRAQSPEPADRPTLMPEEPLIQVSRTDFARLLSRRAQHLLERMADEIEWDEARSALGRQLADAIASERGADVEAIGSAMHWAPAVVAGNTTEAELVRRSDGIISLELMSAAVASYREILGSVARRWAGAIANGHATEVAVVDELGIPAEVVSAAVTEYKRAYGRAALARAAEEAEKAAWTFRSVVDRT